jgi:hypothetical protein
MDRKAALAKIWRETHRDFKGKMDGVKTVMVLRGGGSTLVALDDLTDAEISNRVKEYAA